MFKSSRPEGSATIALSVELRRTSLFCMNFKECIEEADVPQRRRIELKYRKNETMHVQG